MYGAMWSSFGSGAPGAVGKVRAQCGEDFSAKYAIPVAAASKIRIQ